MPTLPHFGGAGVGPPPNSGFAARSPRRTCHFRSISGAFPERCEAQVALMRSRPPM